MCRSPGARSSNSPSRAPSGPRNTGWSPGPRPSLERSPRTWSYQTSERARLPTSSETWSMRWRFMPAASGMHRRRAMDSTLVECSYFGRRRKPPTGMIEFKVTVHPHEEPAVRAELEAKAAAFVKREVYFYDTKDTALADQDLFLRGRATGGK